MGECPDWYSLVKAAQWAGVPPWELAERPLTWREWILAAMDAEQSAQRQQQKRGASRHGR